MPSRHHALRGAALLAAVAGLATTATAQPQGGQVVHGSASFSQNGSQTVITASNGAIINYNSFNIPTGTGVRFIQPGSTSKVLNRVTGRDPSLIGGSLTSNGIVYIVNPAGVFFAHGALVDVGGIYAGAGKISNSDFLSGRNRFTELTGAVENRGTIQAGQGGAVGLFGASVANYGSIVAPQGMVALAAGNEVLVCEPAQGGGTGNFFAKVSGGAPRAGGTGVTNAGTIDGAGGQVMLGAGDLYAVAIDHSGTTRAKDIRLEGGRGGVVSVSGTLDASSTTGRGGTVKVLGDKVGLFGGTVDASGATGGGTVLLGGNRQGQGPERRASATYISADSTVRADATQRGDGGTIIVWSELVTRSFGHLSATGGIIGGDGGFVETSGHRELHLSGTPSVGASRGAAGTWLIDPEDLDIVSTPTTAVSTTGTPPDLIFTSTGGGAQLFVGDLVAALTGGAHVTVQTGNTGSATGGILTLDSGVTLDFNGTGTNTLTLRAHRRIQIDGQILDSAPGGDVLNLVLLADSDANGSGNAVLNNTVNTGGGSFAASGVDFTITGAGSLSTGGGGVTVNVTHAVNLGPGIDAASGDITLNGPVVLTANAALTGHNVTFQGTVNSDATARGLTVTTSGSAGVIRFNGVVGGSSALAQLTTNGTGNTVLNTTGVRAATASFNTPVVLASDVTLNASTGATFGSTLASTSGTHGLTVNSPVTVFNGTVGGGPGGALSSLVTNVGGTTTINAASITSGAVDLRDAVLLGTDVTINGSSSVAFGGTLNSEAGEHNDLTVNSPATTFGGVVGGVDALDVLLTDAVGTTTLNGSAISAHGVFFQDQVILGTDVTVNASTVARFPNTIVSQAIETNDLIVNSPNTTFGGKIGGGTGVLGLLRTDGAGTTFLQIGSGAVPSIDANTIDFLDTVQLNLATSLHGVTSINFGGVINGSNKNLTVDSPNTVFAGAINNVATLASPAGSKTTFTVGSVSAAVISLLGDTVLDVDTTLTGTTSVTLAKVDSQAGESNDLTINSPLTTLTGAMGQGTGGALGALSTDAAGTTTLSGANTTAATVVFNDAVGVGADSTVGGTTSVAFNGTLDNAAGADHSLTVNSPSTLFGAAIGSTRPIGTLTTDAAGVTTIATPTVKGGTIRLEDAVVLNQATTFTGTTLVRFGGALDSANGAAADLTVNSPSTTFAGDVGLGTGGVLGTVTTDAPGATTLGAHFKAGTVDFADEVTLNGNVTTTTAQTYSGPVLLGDDSTLVAPSVIFNGTVNSASSTAHALTVNTSANGVTRFNSPVGTGSALSTITTNADGRTILAGGPVKTTGAQSYDDAVVLGINTTLTGTNITFASTLDSDGIPHSLTVNTLSTGNTTFTGAVGGISHLQRIETNSDGTTKISGGTVATEEAQVYNDNVVLGADTTLSGSALTFGGKLDSDTNHWALTLNSINSGVTTFVGPVGTASTLTTLTTNADGRTRILGTGISTSGVQTYNDAVAVGALTALSGTSLTFNSTINADTAAGSSSLTLNTTGLGTTTLAGRVGGVIPLKGLTTNADGKTRIGADITTAGSQTFNDAVLLFHDATLADTGGTGIAFGSTLDSEGAGRALTLIPNPSSQATVDTPTISRVLFTGTVGGITPFSSITLGGTRPSNPAAATIVAGLNSSGNVIPDYSLVINTSGAFTMASLQKFSVLGDLTVNSGGPATLSDISTLGNLTINAPSIAVQTRPGGRELFVRGTRLVMDREGGVDFVAGGGINFSQTPTAQGPFLTPSFATPDATGISSTLSGFPQRAFGPLTASDIRVGSAVLDLAAVGASSANLAEALPGPAPAISQTERLAPAPGMTSRENAALAEAGLDARLVDARHLPIAAVRRFTEAYDALFVGESVDESGQPVRTVQDEHMRAVLQSAWTAYAAAARDKADPLGFRAYVEAVPEQSEARYILNSMRDLLDRLGQLGLAPGESAQVRRGLLARVTPPALTPEQLEQAVMATQLGGAPLSGPAFAAR